MNNAQKTILIIAHLSMFLARTGFGLIIPLIIYLNSGSLLNKSLKKSSLKILIFQAKITFASLFLQFIGIIYQIAVNFIPNPALTQLSYTPYNPLMIITLLSQLILTSGIVYAVFASIFTARGEEFNYPLLWFRKPQKPTKLSLK